MQRADSAETLPAPSGKTKRTMNATEVLSTKTIPVHRKAFAKTFGKGVASPDEEFFPILLTLWQERAVSPGARLQTLFERKPPKDLPAVQAAGQAYMAFWNSVTELLHAAEQWNGDQRKEHLRSLADEIQREHGEKQYLTWVTDSMMAIMEASLDQLRIPVAAPDWIQQLRTRVDHYAPELKLAVNLLALIAASMYASDGRDSGLDNGARLILLFEVTLGLNAMRKKKQQVRQQWGDTRLKEPCLCGSGLKYRQCCYI